MSKPYSLYWNWWLYQVLNTWHSLNVSLEGYPPKWSTKPRMFFNLIWMNNPPWNSDSIYGFFNGQSLMFPLKDTSSRSKRHVDATQSLEDIIGQDSQTHHKFIHFLRGMLVISPSSRNSAFEMQKYSFLLDWLGLTWIELDWFGLNWIELDWLGLTWIELDWLGLTWIE